MPPVTNFRKATFSFSNGACVEVGSASQVVAVRDSTDRAGVQLAFSPQAWRRFLASRPA